LQRFHRSGVVHQPYFLSARRMPEHRCPLRTAAVSQDFTSLAATTNRRARPPPPRGHRARTTRAHRSRPPGTRAYAASRRLAQPRRVRRIAAWHTGRSHGGIGPRDTRRVRPLPLASDRNATAGRSILPASSTVGAAHAHPHPAAGKPRTLAPCWHHRDTAVVGINPMLC
jgi:hypothetical protein